MKGADRLWRHFATWCGDHGLKALPAHPWTVAAYLRWWSARRSTVPPRRRLTAIARVHVLQLLPPPDRDPTVRKTLRKIEQTAAKPAMRRGTLRSEDLWRVDKVDAPVPDAPPQKKARRGLRSRPRLVRRRPSEDG